MTALTKSSSIRRIFWPNHARWIKEVGMLTLGVLLLTLASQLSIPLKPVSLTFQSTTAVLIGMLYGSRRGAAVIVTYLTLGALGMPCFADFSGGITYFVHPSGGYLLGFLPAAFITGYLAERGLAKHFWSSLAVVLLGTCIIFACGLSLLAAFYGWQQAILFGLMPFVISESIKIITVAALIPRCWQH